MTARLLKTVLGILPGAVVLAACQSPTLPSCEASERRARAGEVRTMSPLVRDSIRQAFLNRSRVQQVSLVQQDCHFRVRLRVDSFTTYRYASVQGIELIRVLKEKAPNETRPLVQKPASEVGVGLYDYVVEFEQRGGQSTPVRPSEEENASWLRLVKPYDRRRISVYR